VPIQLVVDEYNIDLVDVANAVSVPSDVYPYREKLYGYLNQNNQVIHRVYFKSRALYLRFKDFEGLDGVLPTITLNPKTIFNKKFNIDCPDWLTNDLIVELNLLEAICNKEDGDLVNIIIGCVDPTVFTENDFNVAIEKLGTNVNQYKLLLKIDAVRERIVFKFSSSFDIDKHRINSLFDYLFAEQDFHVSLNKLKIEQHTDELRKIVSYFKLNYPLPARTINSELLKISNFLLQEDLAIDLVDKWLEISADVNRLILHEKYSFEDIVKLLISPWPSLLNMIEEFIDININYLTDELLFKLENFASKESKILTTKLKSYKISVEKIEFPEAPNVDTVLKWADGYLDKTRKDFTADNEIDSDNAIKFAHWLKNQGPRISRTNSHWLNFSKQVSQSLKDNKIVVICMIDALSSLHEDLIIDSFSTIEHLTLEKDKLFAPLPTLTEVGKIAVLTGKEMGTHSFTSDQAIKDRYKEHLNSSQSLKIFKSWEDTRKSKIEVDHKLLVFFENRIDERLHDCPSFEKHRKDVKAVLNQLKTKIESWRKDAIMLNKEIVFYITADHGMTVCKDHENLNVSGTIKDRVIKVDRSPVELPKNCSFINIAGKDSGYIVPLDRRYFSSKKKVKVLSHGGLTPEEVLIPNYKLYSGRKAHYQDVIRVELNDKECKKINNKWAISLEFNSIINIDDLRVRFNAPFICNQEVVCLTPGKALIENFEFLSSVEQAGLTEVSLEVHYTIQGKAHKEIKNLSIDFPRKLIEESRASSDFEGMFD